ncbi:MAG TPA: histidine triad nucleotide-binding protein [Candidatus Angelobacter sp.]|jgi:histidine triad (HIT) family protein|nr:histidine triad nucleotide-binding protein [Candidatus Angelobacter sp.]
MSEADCIFCAIAAGTIPATIVHRDADVVAFRDLNPQAPVHVLVIPVEHVASAHDLTPAHDRIWGRVLHVAQAIAEDEGVDRDGYRLVANIGRNGGQTVEHLHVHLLGGRQMTWPPG